MDKYVLENSNIQELGIRSHEEMIDRFNRISDTWIKIFHGEDEDPRYIMDR